MLLARLMEEAAGARLPLRHTVFVLNTEALRFYERLGFVVIGEAGGAYRHMEWLPSGADAAPPTQPPPTA